MTRFGFGIIIVFVIATVIVASLGFHDGRMPTGNEITGILITVAVLVGLGALAMQRRARRGDSE